MSPLYRAFTELADAFESRQPVANLRPPLDPLFEALSERADDWRLHPATFDRAYTELSRLRSITASQASSLLDSLASLIQASGIEGAKEVNRYLAEAAELLDAPCEGDAEAMAEHEADMADDARRAGL